MLGWSKQLLLFKEILGIISSKDFVSIKKLGGAKQHLKFKDNGKFLGIDNL